MTELLDEMRYREREIRASTVTLLRRVIDDIDSDTLESELCEAAIISLAALELAKSASEGAKTLDRHVRRGGIGRA